MLADFHELAQRCAPTVAPETIAAVVTHESRANPFAIGINGGARISRQPIDKQEAVETATRLIGMGLSIDLGLAQINSANLPKLGLTVEQVFDPCTNLRAAETVLRGCYDRASRRYGPGQQSLQSALSCFNTGNSTRGFANGYVASVYRIANAGAGGSVVVQAAPSAASVLTARRFHHADDPPISTLSPERPDTSIGASDQPRP